MAISIFSQEWRDCLRAHYSHVVRTDDKLTERTLRGVMIHEAGFTEADLKQLYVLVTAHVDDVPADFVPDAQILQEEAPVSVAVAMPQQVIESLVVEAALERDEISDGADALAEDMLDAVEMPDDALIDEDADDQDDEDELEDEPPPPRPMQPSLASSKRR